MSEIVEAAGFVLFTKADPPEFLLMQHADRWDLPKGHAEQGEDILTTALRETEEETGLSRQEIVVDPDFQWVTEYDVVGKKRGDYRKRVYYFLGFVDQPFEIELTEHVGYRWFKWPLNGSIQPQTIDPLLEHVSRHLKAKLK